MESALVPVEHDELCRRVPMDLLAEFAADAAARPGDEHTFAGEIAGDLVDVRLDLVAPEKVGLGQITDVARAHPVAPEELVNRGEDLHSEAGLAGEVGDLADHLRRCRGDGDEKTRGIRLGAGALHVVARSQHGDATDREALLSRVVVQQTDRDVRRGRAPHQTGDHLNAALAGTEDQQPFCGAIRGPPDAFDDEAPHVPAGGHEQEPESPAGQDGALGYRSRREVRLVEEVQRSRRDRGRRGQSCHLVEAPVTPAPTVEADGVAGEHLDYEEQRHGSPQPGTGTAFEAQVEPHERDDGDRRDPRRRIDGDSKRAGERMEPPHQLEDSDLVRRLGGHGRKFRRPSRACPAPGDCRTAVQRVKRSGSLECQRQALAMISGTR